MKLKIFNFHRNLQIMKNVLAYKPQNDPSDDFLFSRRVVYHLKEHRKYEARNLIGPKRKGTALQPPVTCHLWRLSGGTEYLSCFA